MLSRNYLMSCIFRSCKPSFRGDRGNFGEDAMLEGLEKQGKKIKKRNFGEVLTQLVKKGIGNVSFSGRSGHQKFINLASF